MSSSDLFLHLNYKKYLKSLFESQRGLLSRMAEAIGVQRSYLSRVTSDKHQLTADQTFKLTRYLNFSDPEQDYFMTLVEFDKASDGGLREHLKKRLHSLKEAQESKVKGNQRPELNELPDILYFSSWKWTAIHFLTSIQEFQSPQSIANKLKLPEKEVRQGLELLLKKNYVKKLGDRWIYQGGEYHLKKDSGLVLINHQNWRLKAVRDAEDFSKESLHYTLLHTVSKKAIPKIKEILLKAIEEANAQLKGGPDEDLVAILIDYFVVD